MGIFSDITDTLFGGTDDSAQDATIEQNKLTREDALRAGSLARGDALSLYPAGDATRNEGYQLAAALLSQLIPQQIKTFQDGNVGAQRALLGGQSRFRNALLGIPDNSAPAAPMRLAAPDPSMFQAQMPQYQQPSLVNVPYDGPRTETPSSQTNVPIFNLAKFLGGGF